MEFPRYLDKPQYLYEKGSEGDKSKGIRIPRYASQNIVSQLSGREMWGDFRRPGTEKHLQRSMCKSIYPNFTIPKVVKPPCYLRKFTPDGKHFIAISGDQMFVEVYHFKGPQAANSLFDEKGKQWLDIFNVPRPIGRKKHPLNTTCRNFPDPDQKEANEEESNYSYFDTCVRGFPDHFSVEELDMATTKVRNGVFKAFFSLKFRIAVVPQGNHLNRECSLFTDDFRYIIVSSVSDRNHSIENTYWHNETLEPNPRYPLDDYSIHLVDIKNGHLSHSIKFKADKIFFSHNQGMYLYDDKLAVLSTQHQTIHIFHISGGRFIPVRKIGRFCHEDDEFIYSQASSFTTVHPRDEAFINSLKHRLLVHIFKKACKDDEMSSELQIHNHDPTLERKPSELSRFFKNYEKFAKLRLWKMQFLDEHHLLLKYSTEEVVTLRDTEPHLQHCMFVVYNIEKTEILAVYENTTDQLVDVFAHFADFFRCNFLTVDARYASSPSNNYYSKQNYERFRQTVNSVRFGNITEATRRILAQIPISSQSFSSSPYLDQSLFSFDEHRISALERPKACGESPIRFHVRGSKAYKFQLHAGITPKTIPSSGRCLVAFMFHPTAPFAMSVERTMTEYVINFHIRIDPYSVMPEE